MRKGEHVRVFVMFAAVPSQQALRFSVVQVARRVKRRALQVVGEMGGREERRARGVRERQSGRARNSHTQCTASKHLAHAHTRLAMVVLGERHDRYGESGF